MHFMKLKNRSAEVLCILGCIQIMVIHSTVNVFVSTYALLYKTKQCYTVHILIMLILS